MDQPPLNLDVVDTADVIEPYKKVVGFFKESVKSAPQALIRNPEIASAQALSKPIATHLGNIIQGYLGGDVPDLKAALRKLNSDFEKDREQALKGAAANGPTCRWMTTSSRTGSPAPTTCTRSSPTPVVV